MLAKKGGAVAKVEELDQDLEAELDQAFPAETSQPRINLPRISFVSQDVIEGKGKLSKVVVEAGTFFQENQTEEDEVDDAGKKTGRKVWSKEELGPEIEGFIIYQRKQLKMYDEATEKYTNSTIFDSEDEEVPLFCDKKQVDKGLPAELRQKYMYTNKKGKRVSALEDNRILYVLFDDGVKDEDGNTYHVYQLNLRGSSMYSFITFARKNNVPKVLIKFSSEPKENGDVAWNQMTFEAVRPIDNDELQLIVSRVRGIKGAIEAEKGQYVKAEIVDQANGTQTQRDALEAARKF